MIELFSTETKPVYIGYNKLAADVAEATTDALTGADYIALQATIKYLWFMVILLAVVALLALVVAVIAKGRADRLDRQLNGTRRGFESRIDDFEDNYDDDGEAVSALKYEVMSMLPNAECVEDGSIGRREYRKLRWEFNKKYSFRINAFRSDFLS